MQSLLRKIPRPVPASGKIFHLQNLLKMVNCLTWMCCRHFALWKGEGAFDCIFMDPPYNQELEQQVLEYLADSTLVDEHTLIIVEADLHTDFAYLDSLGICSAAAYPKNTRQISMYS